MFMSQGMQASFHKNFVCHTKEGTQANSVQEWGTRADTNA
jgi:hypothetical protein